jgi:dolichyl-phosphate beta-glucosyltransferase
MPPSGPPVYLSLIIPAFNEAARIGKSLDRIEAFLRAQPYTFEVIVVDDGSWDGTAAMVRERFAGRPEFRVHAHQRNQGKGGGIRTGMLLGEGQHLFFTDADLSVPIETLPKFLAQLEDGYDVVIGTRKSAGAVVQVHQPPFRELLGKAFTVLSNWILGLRVSDFTCGFKGFRREAARTIFFRQQVLNWSFDSEILYLAKLKGFRVQELPVVWRNDQETKVRLWRDVITSLLGLLRIRLYHFQGKYR